jgi:hypothetical protein
MKPKKSRRAKSSSRRQTQHVTPTIHALGLDERVLGQRSPRAIAASLKRSVMSMLTFRVNRVGKGLSDGFKRVLQQAENELRSLYGRGRSPARKKSAVDRRAPRRRPAPAH